MDNLENQDLPTGISFPDDVAEHFNTDVLTEMVLRVEDSIAKAKGRGLPIGAWVALHRILQFPIPIQWWASVKPSALPYVKSLAEFLSTRDLGFNMQHLDKTGELLIVESPLAKVEQQIRDRAVNVLGQ